MLGFYRAVVKPRAYLLHPVGSAAREKAWRRWSQIACSFARTERANDKSESVVVVVSSGRRSTPGGDRHLHTRAYEFDR